MPKVSVIMPVYNTKEEYLREAIESILKQTYTDFEFIILNDGSTEDVASVIRSYKDKRIKFINNKINKGFIGALNECLDVASGEYIAKMDSDDISLPMRLERQVKFLDSCRDVGMVGVNVRCTGLKNEDAIKPETANLLDFLTGCVTTVFMLRKSIIEQCHLRFREEYKWVEDYDFYARFARYAEIRNIQEVLYLYRWHGDNCSILNKKEQIKGSEKIKKELLNFLTKDTVVQNKIQELIAPSIKKKKWYLFNSIPFLSCEQRKKTLRYTLFGVIPILKMKEK